MMPVTTISVPCAPESNPPAATGLSSAVPSSEASVAGAGVAIGTTVRADGEPSASESRLRKRRSPRLETIECLVYQDQTILPLRDLEADVPCGSPSYEDFAAKSVGNDTAGWSIYSPVVADELEVRLGYRNRATAGYGGNLDSNQIEPVALRRRLVKLVLRPHHFPGILHDAGDHYFRSVRPREQSARRHRVVQCRSPVAKPVLRGREWQ